MWDGIKDLIEVFGRRHGIELFFFSAGFGVAIYCAHTFWHKHKRTAEILAVTAWTLIGAWYLWAFYGSRYSSYPWFEFGFLLALTVAWLCGLWFSVFAEDRRINKLREEGIRLQRKGLYRAAAEKFRTVLASLSLPADRQHYFDTQNRLGECDLQTGPRTAARSDFDTLVARAVDLNEIAWQSRGTSGLGRLDYLDGHSDLALQRYQEAISMSQRAGDPESEAVGRRLLGDLHRFLGQTSEANREYDAALRILRNHPNELVEAGVLRGLGDLELDSSGNTAKARQYLEAADKIYQTSHFAPGAANTQLSFGRLERSMGNFAAARQHYHAAGGIFEKTDDRLGYANSLVLLGEVYRELGGSKDARDTFSRALDLFKAEDEKDGQANCLRGLGHLALMRGDLAEARNKYEAARSLYQQERDQLGQGNIVAGLGGLESLLGKYELCRTYYDDAAVFFTRENNGISLGHLALRRARLEYELGEFPKARKYYDDAVAAISPGDALDSAIADNFLGLLEAALGNYASAQARFQTCRAYFNKSGHVSEEGEALRGLADVAAATGKPEIATQLYAAAKAIFQKTEDVFNEGGVLLRTAGLEINRNKTGLAAQYLDAAQKIFDAAGYQMRQADVLVARGELAKALQDPAAAKTNFAAARTRYDSLGNRFGAACTDFAEAQLGGPAASGLFTVAEASFTCLGLPLWAQKAQAELDKLKAPAPQK